MNAAATITTFTAAHQLQSRITQFVDTWRSAEVQPPYLLQIGDSLQSIVECTERTLEQRRFGREATYEFLAYLETDLQLLGTVLLILGQSSPEGDADTLYKATKRILIRIGNFLVGVVKEMRRELGIEAEGGDLEH